MGEFKGAGSKAGSRREVLRVGVAVLTGGLVIATAARAQDQKVGPELVQYQDKPKDGQKCNACVQWQPPNACAIVSGRISPEGWCAAYAPKEG